jgi:hypothetical protein
MKRQHFYQLPRHIQDRFIQASVGLTIPKPIAIAPAPAPIPWSWIGGALVAFGALSLLLTLGYGDAKSSLALAPSYMLALYGFALAAVAYCVVRAIAHWSEASRFPYRPGRYLFPGVLIDATKEDFQLRSTSALQSVELIGSSGLRVTFEGGAKFDFTRRDAEAAARAKDRLVAAKRELLEAEIKGDDRDRAQLDPLLEPRFSNPLAGTEQLVRPVPKWRLWLPWAAAVGGLLVGVGFGLVRNTLSERRMFAVAVAENTPESLRAYLARGGARPEVESQLLPIAELERLKRQGTLEDLERYSREHPASSIREAIDQAVRDALLTALTAAKEAKTITALDDFMRAHSSHALVLAEVQAARLALMTKAADRFEKEFAANVPDLAPFMRKALTTLAERGPELHVRFVRIVPDSVAKADKTVRKDPSFAEIMLPSQYFDEQHSKVREEKLFASLEQRFSRAFPADTLRLVHAPPLPVNAAIPDQVERPTLFVSHSTNMGSGIGNLNPSGTFVGVGFLFKVHFKTPGWPTPLETKYSTWKPPDLLKLRKGKLTIPEVYSTMADAAFGVFDERLVAWLFR